MAGLHSSGHSTIAAPEARPCFMQQNGSICKKMYEIGGQRDPCSKLEQKEMPVTLIHQELRQLFLLVVCHPKDALLEKLFGT